MTGFAATAGSVPPADWSEFQRIAAEWGCRPVPLPAETTAALRERGLPPAAVDLLTGLALDDRGGPGVSFLRLEGVRGLAEVNGEHAVPWCLDDGLLIFGSGPGGDPAVVDVRDEVGATGWVGHESMHEGARANFAPLAPSPAAFLKVLTDDDAFPANYYETDHFRRQA